MRPSPTTRGRRRQLTTFCGSFRKLGLRREKTLIFYSGCENRSPVPFNISFNWGLPRTITATLSQALVLWFPWDDYHECIFPQHRLLARAAIQKEKAVKMNLQWKHRRNERVFPESHNKHQWWLDVPDTHCKSICWAEWRLSTITLYLSLLKMEKVG